MTTGQIANPLHLQAELNSLRALVGKEGQKKIMPEISVDTFAELSTKDKQDLLYETLKHAGIWYEKEVSGTTAENFPDVDKKKLEAIQKVEKSYILSLTKFIAEHSLKVEKNVSGNESYPNMEAYQKYARLYETYIGSGKLDSDSARTFSERLDGMVFSEIKQYMEAAADRKAESNKVNNGSNIVETVTYCKAGGRGTEVTI